MESRWAWAKLSSLLLCPPRNGIHKGPEFQGAGVAIVKMGEVYDDWQVVHRERDRYIISDKELAKLNLIEDDLLFCRTSLVPEGVGKPAIVRELTEPTVFASNLIRMRVDAERANPRFLLYYFLSNPGRKQTQAIGRGTSVTTITGPDIASLTVPTPPLPEQKAIAEVLGAVDDKIELNRQMNTTLDDLARTIFRSWFVDFDPVRAKMEGRQPFGMDAVTAALFPDHLIASPLGPIPEGWEAKALGDIADNVRDNVPAEALNLDDNYVGLEHFAKRTIALSEWGTAEDISSNKSRFREGDVLFGKLRPYFHKVIVAPISGVCSTDILVIRPTEQRYHALSVCASSSDEIVERATLHSSGTRMPRAS